MMESANMKKGIRAPSSQSVRKRHRVAVVCVNCKRKKTKCDKKRPECDNCVKSKLKCQYQDLVWASSTMVDDDGKMSLYHDYSGHSALVSNEKGQMPFAEESYSANITNETPLSDAGDKGTQRSNSTSNSELPKGIPDLDMTETMNFFEGTLSSDEIVRSGPFSWVIFASKDRFIEFLWLKASQTKQRQILYINNNLKDTPASNDKLHKMRNLKQKAILPSYQPLPTEQLRSAILRNLPTKRTLWILVDRFFEYFYPYFSYLDWKQFIATIKASLDTHEKDFEDERFLTVTITNKTSLCHLAMLFVILRFGYLSLCEELDGYSEDRDYVLKTPITVESVNTAQLLINQFNIFDRPPLELLESYIYMRSYHHYSPEQGDNTGFADSTVFNGIIVSLAVSLGLNRDPSTIEQFRDNIEICNLRRRLWHFVVMFDLYQAVSLGRPVAYNPVGTTVKFPELQGDDMDSVENRLTLGFNAYCKGHEVVAQTASVLADATNVNVFELIKNINKVDELKNTRFKSMMDILHQKIDLKDKPHIRLRKVVQLIRYVFLNTFCFTTEYNIFLHFENSSKGNTKLARFYLSRIVDRSNETMSTLPSLMTGGSEFFGYGLDIVQFPATLLSLHKALQVQTSLSLRCQHLIKLITLKERVGGLLQPLEVSRGNQRYLKYIIKSISKKLENYLENLNNACKTYQYAWRLKRPHTLYWLITSQECFDIRDNKIVALHADEFEKTKPDIPQTNILEGMSLEELMTLYPISSKEMELLKGTKKSQNKDVEDENPLVFSSLRDQRSPSISNLLNHEHEKEENSSTNSPFFLDSPKLPNMKSVVDPSIDENWINLLYTYQNLQTDMLNSQHFSADVPIGMRPPSQNAHSNVSHQQHFSDSGYINQMDPITAASSSSSDQVFQQQNFQHQHHTYASPLPIQHISPNPRLSSHHYEYLNQFLLYNGDMSANEQLTTDNNNPISPHSVESSQLNGSNGLHQFFSLIGAGGFNTIDEMLGSVEFYDKSL